MLYLADLDYRDGARGFMADGSHNGHNHHGHHHGSGQGGMDISHHEKTWAAFWTGTKWSVIGITAIMILLAIFRTNG